MTSRPISRRTFLHLGAVSSAAAVLAACGGESAPASEPGAASAPVEEAAAPAAQVVTGSGGYQEAPMLSELVSAGSLPPVDQRLPENHFGGQLQ